MARLMVQMLAVFLALSASAFAVDKAKVKAFVDQHPNGSTLTITKVCDQSCPAAVKREIKAQYEAAASACLDSTRSAHESAASGSEHYSRVMACMCKHHFNYGPQTGCENDSRSAALRAKNWSRLSFVVINKDTTKSQESFNRGKEPFTFEEIKSPTGGKPGVLSFEYLRMISN